MNFYFKKYIFLLVLLTSIFFGIKGVNASNLNFEYSGYYYNRVNSYSNSSWFWNLYYIDDVVSYCIENGKPEGNPLHEATWEDTNLPQSIEKRILLLAYYGYTYPGHNTLEYRAVTQGMIWEAILGNVVVDFSTERWSNGTILDTSKERLEIENLIEHHYDKPSFDGNSYTVQVGEELVLVDENNAISNYDIYISGATYNIIENTIKIVPTESGEIQIKFIKKTPYNEDYKLYVGDGIQNMIKPGNVNSVESSIIINSYYGYVEGKKIDTENILPQGQATLAGAQYGVFEKFTNKLITTVVTDENGIFKSESILPYNEYYLKELKPSRGYLLDESIYSFSLKGKERETVIVKEQVITNYISILKQYGFVDESTTFLNAEKNIKFEVYDTNNIKYTEITTDKNGYASLYLPYGKWRFHQENVKDGYEKIYDFYVIVNENSEKEQYYNILNNKLSAYLQVIKIDSETKKVIKIPNAIFRILNLDTNQYITQYVGGKIYDEFKTNEDGTFTTYLKLEAGNYRLIETKSPTGYLINPKGVDFTIGDNSSLNYTTYGPIMTIYYENTPIKGQVEINKLGETFEYDGTKFISGLNQLEGIDFDIYAYEDIKSSDGNYIYYKKNDIVDTLTTNEYGYAVSKLLPLGKYYLKEISTSDEYVMDSNEYYFELNQNDEIKTFTLINELKKGTLDFTKTSTSDNIPISNTKIEIYTEDKKLIYKGVTDTNGKIIFENLVIGKYYIIEKEPSEGYVLNKEKIYFDIKEDGEVVKSSMTNKPIEGILEFTKIDSYNNETLSDVLIEVYDINDNLIYSDKTNELGKVIINNLKYGKYYIIEKEPSEGYILNKEKIYFDIKEDGEVVMASMTNKPIEGILEFTKIDSYNNETLSDVLIEVYDINDNLIYSDKTNELGKVIINNLKYGKYYIIEKEPSEGYILNKEKIYFDIKEDGEIVMASMKNDRIIIEVPNTLKKDYFRFILSIINLLSFYLAFYGIYKLNEDKL